jgi:hypothetical protein
VEGATNAGEASVRRVMKTCNVANYNINGAIVPYSTRIVLHTTILFSGTI